MWHHKVQRVQIISASLEQCVSVCLRPGSGPIQTHSGFTAQTLVTRVPLVGQYDVKTTYRTGKRDMCWDFVTFLDTPNLSSLSSGGQRSPCFHPRACTRASEAKEGGCGSSRLSRGGGGTYHAAPMAAGTAARLPLVPAFFFRIMQLSCPTCEPPHFLLVNSIAS